ncbi:MAG: agmatine deiminase family protein [Bryobacterales bacterium]|nr:agmatine deiminase family protein [Bryobacterales bacterium]
MSFLPVTPAPGFEDAVAKDALLYSCSPDREQLREFFTERNLPFVDTLVTRKQKRYCHIFYEPSIPGFRAHTESNRVRGLVFTVDSRSFLSERETVVGDSLDVLKTILRVVERPIEVTLQSKAEVSEKWQSAALDGVLPGSPHRIHLRDNPTERPNVWAQDYIKSGEASGELQTLVTWKSYEDKGRRGEAFNAMLNSLESEGWHRSKLSWDGGDIQFGANPRVPGRTILFYGNSAWRYWGQPLKPEEYEYVLKLEFGADDAVDLSGLAAHIDYFVSILPDGKTLLVSKEMRENLELSQAAIELLITRFGPSPFFDLLKMQFATREGAFGSGRNRALALLAEARKTYRSWDPLVKVDVFERFRVYWNRYCQEDETQCTSGEGFEQMLESDPALAKDWVTEATLLKSAPHLAASLVALLASRLDTAASPRERLAEAKIHDLRKRGFHIVEVPQITGDASGEVPWAGISYVNAAIIDNYVFVPEFGLGAAESRIMEQLQEALPAPYLVVPVYARNSLALNGGVHCVVGFRRSSESAVPREIETKHSTKPQPGELLHGDPARISK